MVPGKIEKYSVGDMYQVADLVITTSVLEGFGFAYLEPWILDRVVIGRSIPFIVTDFQTEGMKLGHLYNVLIVEGKDFKDIGREKSTPESALQQRLNTILKLEDPSFVDRIVDRNETPVRATLRVFDINKKESKRKNLITINKRVVENVYSQEVVGKKLYDVIPSAAS
jgi:hypothetical protein